MRYDVKTRERPRLQERHPERCMYMLRIVLMKYLIGIVSHKKKQISQHYKVVPISKSSILGFKAFYMWALTISSMLYNRFLLLIGCVEEAKQSKTPKEYF